MKVISMSRPMMASTAASMAMGSARLSPVGKRHRMAVRALANVWVRIIQAMGLPRRPDVAATFLAAQHAHAGHAA